MSDQPDICFFLETIFDESTKQVSLRVNIREVGATKPKPTTINSIIELLEQRGYGNYFRFEEKIINTVANLDQRLTLEELDNTRKEKAFETEVIAEARDAVSEVKVSEDNMQALIAAIPAKGGKPLDLEQAKILLKEAEVKHGIEEQLLFDLFQACRDCEPDKTVELVVANGSLPINGENSQFIPLVDTANERVLKPQLRPDGSIDMRELGDLPTVSANQPIMRKELFTLGEPGVDVRGNSVPAEPGLDFDFTIAAGSMVNPTNNKELLSEINGQPNLVERGMTVENVVKVDAVDLSTGNLNIDANLLVVGDIIEGMKVKCTGDITVGGVIEAADVESEGSILVGKGIVGHIPVREGEKIDYSSTIKAGKKINAMFASYTKLEAGVEVHMDEQMLHCDTTTKGKVTVGNPKTVSSQIIGGTTRSYTTIECDIFGSHAGILTILDLSGPFQEKQDALVEFEQDIEEKNQQVISLSRTYSKLVGKKRTPELLVQLKKIKNTIDHMNKLISRLNMHTEKMREVRDAALLGMSVLAKRKVNALVQVNIGTFQFRSKRTMESGTISYLKDDVCFQPANLDKNN